MTWQVPQILQLAGAAIIGLLVVLYKYHEDRLKTLEITRQNKVDADVQRAELREELAEIGQRIEVIRTETNSKMEKQFDQTNQKLDKLFDQMAALASTYAKRKR